MHLDTKKQTHVHTHKGNIELYPFTANGVTHLMAITTVGPDPSTFLSANGATWEENNCPTHTPDPSCMMLFVFLMETSLSLVA